MSDNKIKVFNLTDVETPTLQRHGLVGQTFVVGTEIVSPGQSVEIADTPENRAKLEHFLIVGAACINKLPPPYALAKGGSGHRANVTQPPQDVKAEVPANTEEATEAKPSSKGKKS